MSLSRIFNAVGFNKAILLTVFSRIIQAVGGLGSLFFIAKYLAPSEQGYYYTFASVLAIQIFFELGLSGIITQYTAHEFAHLTLKNNKLEGNVFHQSRLSSLLRFCVKWFGIVALVLFFVLLLAGFVFFNKFNKTQNVEWQIPWVILCASTSINLFIDPILAYFDGLGEVEDMARLRLIQKTTSVIFLCVFFLMGFKLYSGALASILSVLVNYAQVLFSRRLTILKEVWNKLSDYKIAYFKEVFPLQWKIAISWISGYFIFQLFNPVLFATEGAIVAGRMGMTLQVLNGISAITMSWIVTKIPLFSNLIAKNQIRELDRIFSRTLKQMILLNVGSLISVIVLVSLFNVFELTYADRFLPIEYVFLLCLTVFVNHFIFAWATYLRCHKKEPFLVNSIIGAILICLSTLIFGNIFGVRGIVIGYTIITVFVSWPWSYFIFNNRKKVWH